MNTSLRKAIDIIVRTTDPDKIILFGSRAKGGFKEESDYDVCVLKKELSIEESLPSKSIGRSMVSELL
jgi:predicted nucleotidyltransferase